MSYISQVKVRWHQGLAITGVLLALAVLALLLTVRPAGAQEATTVEYAENGEDVVATFTAVDPEGATSIAWFLGTASIEGVGTADVADIAEFEIDAEDGMLKFIDPPDFENPPDTNDVDNSYKVVVAACDMALETDETCDGNTGYHKVTVMVTDVSEPGEVTLATNTANGTPQYLVGAILTATASDGDITDANQDFTVDRGGEVSGVTWRWYRGGTEITGADAQDNNYTLLPADAGQHIRAVVYYIVAGNVDQETAEKTTDYPVLEARVGANQLEFAPATVSRTISEGDKGRNVGAPVTATGNHGTVRYSLDDTGDATTAEPRFKIDEKTGQITTDVVLDYEGESAATATTSGSCATAASDAPDRECTVTVTATDSTGEAATTNATVTIMLTDVNEKPEFTSGSQAVTVPEGSTDLFGLADNGYTVQDVAEVTYTAMDPEGLTVNYSLTGPDASKFQIKGSPPVLSFLSGPDFEAKASADRDNVYEVTVRASVGGDTGERMVRVTVGGVDEGPDVSGLSARSFAENGEGVVATFTAVDPEGATSIAWLLGTASIAGVEAGDVADNAHFMIDEEDGMLKFIDPPDFENPPTSNDVDNSYKVVVAACDVALVSDACPAPPDGNIGYHKVTVMVTNVNEPGKVTLATSTSGGTPQYLVGATLTATASDGDITNATQTFTADVTDEVSGVTWRWYRGGTEITGTDAQDHTYTLLAADENSRIRAEVRYQVDGKTRQETAAKTTDYPVLADRQGASQLTFAPATVSRTISEGDKGRNVGAPVTATGNHGTVRYNLDAAGDNALFKIDEKTGQITTEFELDYEGESVATAADAGSCTGASTGSPVRECTVTVEATDSTGTSTGTDPNFNAIVTITITDVNEKPEFTSGSQTVTVPENSTDLFGDATSNTVAAVGGVTYEAMDPEGLTVNYSLTGPDASKFQIRGSTPVLSFLSGPDFEAKASADRDNVYEVTVRASVGNDTGERMVRVTVANVPEGPTIMSSGGAASITGPVKVTYQENASDDVATYNVVGAGDRAVMWSSTGADGGAFNANAGVLTFKSPPDFEAKSSYDVTVQAVVAAGGGRDSETVTRDVVVTIANEDEAGTVSITPSAPSVGTTLTAQLMDPDGMTNVSWQWARENKATTSYDDIAGATAASYMTVDADGDNHLRVTVTYTDDFGSKTLEDTTAGAVTTRTVDYYDSVAAGGNDNGVIDAPEVLAAVRDYFAGNLPAGVVLQAVSRYFAGT